MKILELHNQLLQNIKSSYSELSECLEEINSHWGYEDLIYRFYHGSFKVYALQMHTTEIVLLLEKIAPKDCIFCSSFEDIIKNGGGRKEIKFKTSHNEDFDKHTRPIVEAFFHAKYFLGMAVKYGTLKEAPELLPSGWACLLELYKIR